MNRRTLLNVGIEAPPNSRLIQLQCELQQYRLGILGLSETNSTVNGDHEMQRKKLKVIEERFPKGDILIMIDKLNTKVGSDSTLPREVMSRHGFRDQNNNGKRYLTSSRQIDNIAIRSRVGSCLLGVRGWKP